MSEFQQNQEEVRRCPRGTGQYLDGQCHHQPVKIDILGVEINDFVDSFTHIKVVTFAENTQASKFIIVPSLKVVFSVVKTKGEAAATIAAYFYADVTSGAHGAVKAVAGLGEDRVESLGRGSRCKCHDQQNGEGMKPHDAMSDVSLRGVSIGV